MYMNHTARTLGHDSLWLEGVPELGFQYPCILSLVLAFSAHHQARRQPADAPRLLPLAERHSNKALQSATQLLQYLDKANSPALYISSVLICFTAFANGPTPGNLLLVAEDGQVPWLSLLGGVRLVINTMGWSSVFSGPLAKHFPGSEESNETAKERDSPKAESSEPGNDENWRSSLNEISDLIPVFAEEPFRTAYATELARVTQCYETTFGRGRDAAHDTQGQMQTIMSWIYGVDDTFVEGVKRRDPIPLIILGHFSVLLRTLEQYWFVEGWGPHLMQEILRISEASGKWLRWPKEFLDATGKATG